MRLAVLLLAICGLARGADLDSTLPVTISSGSRTAGISATGRLQVEPSAVSGTQDVNIISTFSSTNAGYVRTLSTFPVSGTFFQAVQPVSQSGSFTVTPGTGAWSINIVSTFSATNPGYVMTTSTFPVSGTFWQSVQPVSQSGSFTVTPGTGTWAVSGATQTTIGLSSGAATVGVTSDGRLKVDVAAAAVSNYYGLNVVDVNAPTSGTDNPLLMLINLSTNTKNLVLVSRIYSSKETTGVITYKAKFNPVFTSSGTNVSSTIFPINAGAVPSKMFAYTVPTVTSSTQTFEGFAGSFPYAPIFLNDAQSISISPGKKLLITGNPGTVNKTTTLSLKWIEQ